MVVGRYPVKSHEPAHGGTGEDGVVPVGQSMAGFVNIGLQLLDHPVQHGSALAPDGIVLGIGVGHGGILDEPPVSFVVALHGDDNQILRVFLQKFRHAPGLAVGSVLVKKHVVPVEHIHYRIPLVRIFLVVLGKPEVRSSGAVPGKLWDRHIPFIDHFSIFSPNNMGFAPSIRDSIIGKGKKVNSSEGK